MINNSANNINSLLSKVAEGNENAFGQLFKTYDNQLNGYVSGITRSEWLTQEIVQDVFLKIWITRSSVTKIDSFKAYLFTTARNHTYDCLRQINREKRREKEWVDMALNHASDDLEEAAITSAREQIDEAIELLPPQQKKIYALRRGGMKQMEIAGALNISIGTVKKHIALAKRFLKNQVKACC